MKFSFWGNAEFSALVLKTLAEKKILPEVVVTTAPKPLGRKEIITPNLVEILARQYNLDVLYGDDLKAADFLIKLKERECQTGVVASFGKILPKEVLKVHPFGLLNIHPSLLPKYRGPSPIQTVLLNGEKETGVSLFIIDEFIDHGPIIAQSSLEIQYEDDYETLLHRLAELGAKLVANFLPLYLEGKVVLKPQDETQVSLTKKFTFNDGKIDWNSNVFNVYNKIRALFREPGVYSFFIHNNQQKMLKIYKAFPFTPPSDFSWAKQNIFPGKTFNFQRRLIIACLDGFLELLLVQPEGKIIMKASDFLNGYQPEKFF